MSNKLKDILKTGEGKFDLNAWNKVNEQLNKSLPVKNTFFVSKMVLFSSGIIFTTLLVYFNVGGPSKISESILAKKVAPKNVTINSEVNPQGNSNLYSNESNVSTDLKLDLKSQIESKQINRNEAVSLPSQINKNEQKLQEIEYQSSNNKNEENRFPETLEKGDDLIFPLKPQYCLGEKITIYNSNAKNIILSFEDSEIMVIPNNSKKSLLIEKAGEYVLKSPSYPAKQKVFQVGEKKNLNVNFTNELIYEGGIPYVELSSKDFNENSTWKSSKGLIVDQKEVTRIRCFQKGNYSVILSQTDENACVNEEKIDFQIKEEYNLLAVNAFVPNDHNYKNRTFMPEALKYRSTSFQLTIFDPKDNHVAFQTSSVDLPWDGIDQMTGKMVDANKLFVWKVSLKNPELGEKSEYTGTIVRL